ncbi:MAG: YihY/virulence factor BrkB family protein [Sedimentitalea sp.]
MARKLFTIMTPFRTMARFNDSGGWVLSSHVAMSLMLALFPFVLFIVALAGAVSWDVDVEELITLVFGVWPDSIARPIVTEIRAVLDGGQVELITLGGILALYFASNGVDAVRLAISQAYRDDDPRPFWKTRALSVVFVLIGGSVILGVLILGVVLPAYFLYLAPAVPDAVVPWLESRGMSTVVTLAVLAVLVAACHIWLPGLRHSLRDIWPGVLVTVALWWAATWGFSIYMSYFANYSATYAGLAGVMAALIFLYLMAAILILGAHLNGHILDNNR